MRGRGRVWTGILLLVAILASCQRSSRIPTEPDGIAPEITWPQAPQRARIRFVKTVARPQDLGIRPSFWHQVGDLFAGKSEDAFIRPTGVAARGSTIYVADPGAQALWILDGQAGRCRAVREAGKARLIAPVAVTVGGGDEVYVADSRLAKVLLYDSRGELKGTIADTRLNSPAGLAYDPRRDRLYVADSSAHGIWIFSGSGVLLGVIGRRGTGAGEFNFPTHLAVDREGGLYVTDALNFRIQIFSAEEQFTGQFGEHGDFSGKFAMPKGVASDSKGHIYVVEALFDALQIFDRQGRYLLTVGERGTGPGQFWLPNGVFIDARDRIYVADAYNRRIQILEYLPGGEDE